MRVFFLFFSTTATAAVAVDIVAGIACVTLLSKSLHSLFFVIFGMNQ